MAGKWWQFGGSKTTLLLLNVVMSFVCCNCENEFKN